MKGKALYTFPFIYLSFDFLYRNVSWLDLRGSHLWPLQVDRTRCPHLEPLLGGGSFCLVSGAGHLTIQKGEHIEELQLNADQHEVHVLQSGGNPQIGLAQCFSLMFDCDRS